MTPTSLENLKSRMEARLTAAFLDGLLEGMEFALGPVGYLLLPGFKNNIDNFRAKYLFTAGMDVHTSVTFSGGHMSVSPGAIADWDTRVSFSNPSALRDFLLSKDQDILNSILNNEVSVDGNLAMIYKFGFVSRDLMRRIGIGRQ